MEGVEDPLRGGGLAERLNAPLSKSGIFERGSQVQILYPPPLMGSFIQD